MLTVCHVCICSHRVHHLSDCGAASFPRLIFSNRNSKISIGVATCVRRGKPSRHILVKMHKETRWAFRVRPEWYYFESVYSSGISSVFPSFLSPTLMVFVSIKLIKEGGFAFGFRGLIWRAEPIIIQNCCMERWRSVNCFRENC